MNRESVSVIIPTRDRPELLNAAVQSVLRQTRAVEQIIVVDDASESRGAFATLAALSPTIEIVTRSVRGGPAAARNTGIDRARGEFLLFLDDDDLIDPRFVEEGLAVLRLQPAADAVFFLYQCILHRENHPASFSAVPPFEGKGNRDGFMKIVDATNPVPQAVLEQRPVTAFIRYLVPVNSGLIRKSVIGDARFPESLRQGEDTYFWILLATRGRRFVFDPRAFAFVRRHPGNTTRSRARYIDEIQACYEKLLQDGLLTAPDDVFLAYLKLLLFKCLTGRPSKWRYLRHVLGSPSHLAREFGFWIRNVRPWRRFLA
jgi:glycosyltransferase involved in cell wall biosynthesis